MILKTADIDEIRQVGPQGVNALRSLQLDDISMAAALELACCCWEWEQQGAAASDAAQVVRSWAESFPQLKDAQAALNCRGFQPVPHADLYASPPWEICAAPSELQLEDNDWMLFQERFKRSLRQHGFALKIALALSDALREMAENIPRHSSLLQSVPAAGAIGYHVQGGCMSFAVADVGQGVLHSLRRNPKWASVSKSTPALRLAVWDCATSDPNAVQGDGFRQVHRSLSDLNGLLRFRSGDGLFTVDGRGPERKGVNGYPPAAAGLQICVSCALIGNPNLGEL